MKKMSLLLWTISLALLCVNFNYAYGEYESSTAWGSYGSDDSQFSYPSGVAVDDGYVYVADSYNCNIQKFDSSGTFVTAWGSCGSDDSQFSYPSGVAVDADGYVYVADSYNCRIQKFDSLGTFVTEWGSYGLRKGQFYNPSGVAVHDGYVYVADTFNCRIQKFDSSGTFVTEWGFNGGYPGQFSYPSGIAVDEEGYVYVADTDNFRIQKFDSSGTFVTAWGFYGKYPGEFITPLAVAVDADGYVYVADTFNCRIQKFDSSGTFVSKWGWRGEQEVHLPAPGDVYLPSMKDNPLMGPYPAYRIEKLPHAKEVIPKLYFLSVMMDGSWLFGQRAFLYFSVGKDEIVIFDTGEDGYEYNGEDIKSAIQEVSDKPVGAIYLTHKHPDHVGNAISLQKALENHPPIYIGEPDYDSLFIEWIRFGGVSPYYLEKNLLKMPFNPEVTNSEVYNPSYAGILKEGWEYYPACCHTPGNVVFFHKELGVIVIGNWYQDCFEMYKPIESLIEIERISTMLFSHPLGGGQICIDNDKQKFER
ncbi:MAG: MBL fold metallo-hydrolase [Proteobacteria bacterium]|nr:MBL fold metallo-hydrolase [Pseudomonadota bacterium]